MNKVKLLITWLNAPRLLLHVLFFYLHRKELLPDVKAQLKHRRMTCGSVMGLMYLLVFDKTFRNLYYWRIGKAKYLMYYWLPPHPSFVIGTNQQIGGGFLGVHPIGSFVNAERIGRNFEVKHGVTIGYNGHGRPIIGDNVQVNAHAIVVGGVVLGNNVVVGAGAAVTKSVPDNCVVVGNPAYIIRRDGIAVKEKL